MEETKRVFMIGAATSAHQVEGNNVHSDYWTMEHMKSTSFLEPSLDAVDHYNRYEEDIRLLSEAGLNAYRFSIEWARIEPREGEFDENEIKHYADVLDCCKRYGVLPIVTLHHFTSPKWLIERGGWECEDTVGYFARYCGFVCERLGDRMSYVCTINEANMGLQLSVIAKRYLKKLIFGKKSSTDGKAQVGVNLQHMLENMKLAKSENAEVFGCEKLNTFVSSRTKEGDLLICRAHIAAKKAIKEKAPHVKVGLTLSLHDMQADKFGARYAKREWYSEFGHYLPYVKNDDFIGVQNYSRTQFGIFGQKNPPKDAEMTQMNYEFYPEALGNVIRTVAKDFDGEIIVTENGIATNDDTRRCEFIRRALSGVKECVNDGIKVIGYFHWSLLDNFEWQKGYDMTFGLIGVDRKTQVRYPKESLRVLGEYSGKI